MANKSDKSNAVALLLCFLVGFLGVHRFYVGRIGTGAAQLLCCVLPVLVAFRLEANESGTLVIPLAIAALATLAGLLVWTLVDGVMIVMQKFTDSRGNVLKFN